MKTRASRFRLPAVLFKPSRLILALATMSVAVAAAEREVDLQTAEGLREAYSGPVESWPAAQVDPGADFAEFGPLPPRRKLEGQAALRAALGRRLFVERHLSGSGQIACVSCHDRELGFGDGLRQATGHDLQKGQRNAQSLFTAAFMHELFWDGRSPSLEDQAHHPIVNPLEMAADPATVVAWINKQPDYREAFREAYGIDTIAMDDITRALADFERSLRPPRSKWDRVFTRGTEVLTDQELRGLHLFRTKARCANCHSGPLLSDERYHSIGMAFYARKYEDVGRWDVTGKAEDVGRFRTPSLRGVRRTKPYMHNGLIPSLRGVVNLYAGGGGKDRTEQSETTSAPPPQRDPLLRPLDLNAEERAALVAFLETL